MALHRKWNALAQLDADIAVISEAAHPEQLAARGCDLGEMKCVWAGRVEENRNKGLLVLAKPQYQLKVASIWEPRLEIFLPVEVSGAAQFNLLATWSFGQRAVATKTPSPDAFLRYREWLGEGLMLGDFNNHVRWDRPRSEWTFRRFAQVLGDEGLASLYHERNELELVCDPLT